MPDDSGLGVRMPLINWDKSLSVGVESIDAQHKVLVETLNELHDAMMKGQAKGITGAILRNLVAYTQNHFKAEEAMLAAAKYPGLAAHRALHEELSKQVADYLARFERGEITLNLHLLGFLRDWLTKHIQKVDRAYGPSVIAQGAR
jgi:hemerythrin